MKLIFTGVLLSIFLSDAIAQNLQTHPAPADKKATAETKYLFENLRRSASKGIMFGHQDDLDYGIGWKEEAERSDVRSVAGDYPAVFGWELGNVEFGGTRQLDSVSFDNIRRHIKKVYAMGGINTISWHINNPLTGGTAWDVSSDQVVKSILPGGANHAKYQEWLGKVATFLKSLKDDNGTSIPILFRPFHELTGSWFWWGKKYCTPEEYKQLWKFTVTFLRDQQEVHNLLYIYSTDVVENKEEYLERYPGDDFSDGFGIDIYHRDNHAGTKKYMADLKRCLPIVSGLAQERNKIGAFTETGLEEIPMADWWTEILWKNIQEFKLSYVLVWRNATGHYYAPYPGQVSSADFKKFAEKPGVLFLKGLSNMYK